MFAPSRLLRRCAITFFFGSIALCAFASTPYERLQLKADRFFDQQEWAQAAATYYQMLEQKPQEAATYGRAIVANAVRGDSPAEMSLMVKALNNKVPFDSVLARVKSTSFALGKSNLYGDFLLKVREEYPWMRRPIDNYLLRYYIYRRDGAKMMEYSQLMLKGDTRNLAFLDAYAKGAMLCGKDQEGIATYQQMLAIDPDNYDTLLTLGNYYYLRNYDAIMPQPPVNQVFPPSTAPKEQLSRKQAEELRRRLATTEDAALARDYLGKANALHPTPHVTSLLSSITLRERK